MFCSNCGICIEHNSNFCPNCGMKIIEFHNSLSGTTANGEKNKYLNDSTDSNRANKDIGNRSSSFKKKAFIICIIILAIVIPTVILILIRSGKQSSKNGTYIHDNGVWQEILEINGDRYKYTAKVEFMGISEGESEEGTIRFVGDRIELSRDGSSEIITGSYDNKNKTITIGSSVFIKGGKSLLSSKNSEKTTMKATETIKKYEYNVDTSRGYYTDNSEGSAKFIDKNNEQYIINGFKKFYNKTGVYPHLYIIENVPSSGNVDNVMQQYADRIYEELFNAEGNILFVYVASEDDYWVTCGYDIRDTIDDKYIKIIYDSINSKWNDGNLARRFGDGLADAVDK